MTSTSKIIPESLTSRFIALLMLIGATCFVSCSEKWNKPKPSWHDKFQWRAHDYFDDLQVIALCKAIEANDLNEIDRLVAAGANVNAVGKDGMTPLLWSFPDNKVPRFQRLLAHGADPNIRVTSDLNTRGGLMPGTSVTYMACKTSFPGYFDAVFANGGDCNQLTDGVISGHSPLLAVITGSADRKPDKINVLIKLGADINHVDGGGSTAVMQAVSWGGQFDIALLLLEAGADFNIYKPDSNSKVVHLVAKQARLAETWTPKQKSDYQKLVNWLESHGESLAEAKADIARWMSWSGTPAEIAKKRRQEIAQRENREKAAAKDNAP